MLLKGKRILIVEDDIMNRVVYRVALNVQGALVEFDSVGADTIWKVKRSKPDLIILDLMLPKGHSGHTIYDEIRQLEGFKTIPIVAISASDPSIAIPRVRSQGFNGFIAKPINQANFTDQILRLLKGEEVWDAGRQTQY